MEHNITNVQQAELEITLIKKIMEDSRKVVYNSSIQGIYWTFVMTPAIILNYLMYIYKFGLAYVGILWITAVAVGTAGSIIIARKERRMVRVKTFAGKLLATIGIAIGGANIMFSIASGLAHAFHPIYIVSVDSVVMGMGFYVIGVIQQLKTLKILSFIWWAGAIFFFVFPSIHCLLFLAIMLILTILLPRIEEKNKSKNKTA